MITNVIYNRDCYEELKKIKRNSIDLILTDPPYKISKDSNFDKSDNDKFNKLSNYFGEWDEYDVDFNLLMKEYYRILKKGGTLIIFNDIFKFGEIKEIAESNAFKQCRVGIWVKLNPIPLNSSDTYLSNSKEYFLSFVKSKNSTFNSEYNNAIYEYPICNGNERLDHPNQKPLGLIEKLINVHSNEGDVVLDTFSGSGTIAEACVRTNRKFICYEKDEYYYNISIKRLKKYFK